MACCRIEASGELDAIPLAPPAPIRAASGPESGPEPPAAAGLLLSSSSSPKKLFIADIAGLRPAMASGVSSSDGSSGAENNKPKLSGLDSKLEASPLACLSAAVLARTKTGA